MTKIRIKGEELLQFKRNWFVVKYPNGSIAVAFRTDKSEWSEILSAHYYLAEAEEAFSKLEN